MKRLVYLVLAAAALACTIEPAFASNGWKRGAESGATVRTVILPSEPFAFFHIDSTASLGAFSNVLDTRGAQRLDFLLIPDNAQAGAGSCEVRIFSKASDGGAAVTASTGRPEMSADTDGDGIQNDATLDGRTENRRGLTWVGVPGVAVEIVALPGAGEQCLLWVRGSF